MPLQQQPGQLEAGYPRVARCWVNKNAGRESVTPALQTGTIITIGRGGGRGKGRSRGRGRGTGRGSSLL